VSGPGKLIYAECPSFKAEVKVAPHRNPIDTNDDQVGIIMCIAGERGVGICCMEISVKARRLVVVGPCLHVLKETKLLTAQRYHK
jgi:hypothetical protein